MMLTCQISLADSDLFASGDRARGNHYFVGGFNQTTEQNDGDTKRVPLLIPDGFDAVHVLLQLPLHSQMAVGDAFCGITSSGVQC